MSALDFDSIIGRILTSEGEYVNSPSDPGGETKFGISHRMYPQLDIKNLTFEQAKALWYADYWAPFNRIPHISVHYQLFDAAVHHGQHNATQFLQRAVETAEDGIWGQFSQAAYEKHTENDILLRYIGYRMAFMTKLRHFKEFGKGWTARMARNLLYAASDNRG